MTYTVRTKCPHCGSDDCSTTREELGELIHLPIAKLTVHCNSCTYTKVSLLANRREIVTETKEPEFEDTDIEYKYLGRLPG